MQLLERFDALQDFIRSGDTGPAHQQYEVFEELNLRLQPEMKRLQRVYSTQVPAFNDAVSKMQLKVVDPMRVVKEGESIIQDR